MAKYIDRRQVLVGGMALVAAGLAGCSDDDGEENESQDEGGGGGGGY